MVKHIATPPPYLTLLVHFDEPCCSQKCGIFDETPVPRARIRIEDAARRNPRRRVHPTRLPSLPKKRKKRKKRKGTQKLPPHPRQLGGGGWRSGNDLSETDRIQGPSILRLSIIKLRIQTSGYRTWQVHRKIRQSHLTNEGRNSGHN